MPFSYSWFPAQMGLPRILPKSVLIAYALKIADMI